MSFVKNFLSVVVIAYAILNLYSAFMFFAHIVIDGRSFSNRLVIPTIVNVGRILCSIFLLYGAIKARFKILILALIFMILEIILLANRMMEIYQTYGLQQCAEYGESLKKFRVSSTLNRENADECVAINAHS